MKTKAIKSMSDAEIKLALHDEFAKAGYPRRMGEYAPEGGLSRFAKLRSEMEHREANRIFVVPSFKTTGADIAAVTKALDSATPKVKKGSK